MAAKYWIKLYHEILYDPKMGMMSDRLWRRTIELFLLAGEVDNEGTLPPLDEIAWKLRLDKEQLETEMIELQEVGILSRVEGRWYVTKFAERQQPMDKAEYMRRKREGETRGSYYQGRYQSVTKSNTDNREDTDTDKIRKDTEEMTDNSAAIAAVSTAYENNVGALTPMLADDIADMVDEYPLEWILYSIKTAVQSEKRNLRYIRGILRNIKREGFNTNGKPIPSGELTAEVIDSWLQS